MPTLLFGSGLHEPLPTPVNTQALSSAVYPNTLIFLFSSIFKGKQLFSFFNNTVPPH